MVIAISGLLWYSYKEETEIRSLTEELTEIEEKRKLNGVYRDNLEIIKGVHDDICRQEDEIVRLKEEIDVLTNMIKELEVSR